MSTASAAGRRREVDPVLYPVGGLPLYRAGMVPAQLGLGTRRQLHAEGLSVAGLRPAAWLHYSALHGICPLYQRAAARPLRKLTQRQREALAAGRALVGTVVCERCASARSEYDRQHCAPCQDVVRAEHLAREAERQRRAAEAHAAMLAADRAAASAWAAQVLADPDAVVLDSETTGLGGSYAIELAVVRVIDRAVLLDTRLDPLVPIEDGATAVHGVTDTDVAGELEFSAVAEQLRELLAGRRVVVYNADFDRGVLTREWLRLDRSAGAEPRCPPWDEDQEAYTAAHNAYRAEWRAWHERLAAAEAAVEQLLSASRWECAMERYAAWHGDWHEYFGSYTWQRLGGGHTAAGDCQTVIDRLAEMTGAVPALAGQPL